MGFPTTRLRDALSFKGFTALATRHLLLPDPPSETEWLTTEDGWQLRLLRVRRTSEPPNGALMLVHGLSANRFIFHYPGRSLAGFLANAGFDCFIAELRGRGVNRPPGGTLQWDWDLEDYLVNDLPAIIGRIRALTKRDRLGWIGHSLGGVLLLAYLARFGNAEIARGAVIGSALDYSVGKNDFQRLAGLLPLLKLFRKVPYAAYCRSLALVAGSGRNPLERFDYFPQNIERPVVRRYYANVCQDIAPGVLRQLATTFEPGGFSSRDGRLKYAELASRIETPLLFVAGDQDRQVSVEAVRAAVATVSSREKELRVAGLAAGHQSHYGHFDLVLGRRAETEVWPWLTTWFGAPEPE